MDFPILTAILLCPVIGMLVILGVPGSNKRAIRYVALAAAGASMVLSLIMYASFDLQGGKYQFVEKVTWVESFGISYHLDRFVRAIAPPQVLGTRTAHLGDDDTGTRRGQDISKGAMACPHLQSVAPPNVALHVRNCFSKAFGDHLPQVMMTKMRRTPEIVVTLSMGLLLMSRTPRHPSTVVPGALIWHDLKKAGESAPAKLGTCCEG